MWSVRLAIPMMFVKFVVVKNLNINYVRLENRRWQSHNT